MRRSESGSPPNPPGAHGTGGVLRLRVGLGRPHGDPLGEGGEGPSTGAAAGTGPGEDRLGGLLRQGGHLPSAFPLTRIDPPADRRPLVRGARGLLDGEYQVLLLTSARAVPPLLEALDEASEGRGWVRPRSLRVWVVGVATGAAAAAAGLAPDRIPDRFVAEGLIEAAEAWETLKGTRVLFPRAAEGRELLPEALASSGAHVTLVEAYRAVEDPGAGDALLAAAGRGDLDVVVLTAGSQARVLAGALLRSARRWPSRVELVAIGPATRAAARAAGLPDPVVADPHTLDGVVAAVESLARRRGEGDQRVPHPGPGSDSC
jgi:uroporphyrinogen III methyltransferase / synthase